MHRKPDNRVVFKKDNIKFLSSEDKLTIIRMQTAMMKKRIVILKGFDIIY